MAVATQTNTITHDFLDIIWWQQAWETEQKGATLIVQRV